MSSIQAVQWLGTSWTRPVLVPDRGGGGGGRGAGGGEGGIPAPPLSGLSGLTQRAHSTRCCGAAAFGETWPGAGDRPPLFQGPQEPSLHSP